MPENEAMLADEIRVEIQNDTLKFIEEEPVFKAHLSTPVGLIDTLIRASNAQKKVIAALATELSKYVEGGTPLEMSALVSEYLGLDATVAESIRLNTGIDLNVKR